MNREIQREWSAALRSGEYEQGKGNLTIVTKDDDGNVISEKDCCLGVPSVGGCCVQFRTDRKDM